MRRIATVLMPCSRCGGVGSVAHAHNTARGTMCERCLVEMPKEELADLRAAASEWEEPS